VMEIQEERVREFRSFNEQLQRLLACDSDRSDSDHSDSEDSSEDRATRWAAWQRRVHAAQERYGAAAAQTTAAFARLSCEMRAVEAQLRYTQQRQQQQGQVPAVAQRVMLSDIIRRLQEHEKAKLRATVKRHAALALRMVLRNHPNDGADDEDTTDGDDDSIRECIAQERAAEEGVAECLDELRAETLEQDEEEGGEVER